MISLDDMSNWLIARNSSYLLALIESDERMVIDDLEFMGLLDLSLGFLIAMSSSTLVGAAVST